VRKKVKLLR